MSSNKRNRFGDEIDPYKNGRLFSGNCLYKTFFLYCYKVLKKGNQKSFEAEDCYEIEPYQLYGNNFEKFSKLTNTDVIINKGLSKVLFDYIFRHWIWIFTAFTIGNGLGVLFPFILRDFINWIQLYKLGAQPGTL